MTAPSLERAIAAAADEIQKRGRFAALTGAGISVESGIPDFRSSRGIWAKYAPAEYATIDAFRANPVKVWRFLIELGDLLRGVTPNAAHRALADLERAGRLSGIATQNVDRLHQAAGSRVVHELHGSGARVACMRCGRPVADEELAELRAGVGMGRAPTCEACGGLVKPAVVLFGEMLPAATITATERLILEAPVLLVVGTSGTVWPVAGLPERARRAGAHVIELNLAPTEFSDDVAHQSLFGPAGEVLPKLAARLLR